MREGRSKLSYFPARHESLTVDKTHSKNPFRVTLHRSKSADHDKKSANFAKTRYVFSYELPVTEQEQREKGNRRPSVLASKMSVIDELIPKESPFDFGPAFEFTGPKEANTLLDHDPQYKTIFTYSDPVANPLPIAPEFEIIEPGFSKDPDAGTKLIIVLLSTLLLIIFLPFIGWFFIKHLSNDKRAIVFRLGKRLKTKGPGWVTILPICDQYHLISLSDQTLKIKPVSGGTEDKALVEVSCSLVYRLLEPDYAFSLTTKSPQDIVATQAQLCLLSSLTRLQWPYLEQGGAKVDLAADTKGSLNSRCGVYGIHIIDVSIEDVKLLRAPTDSSKVDISTVSKQLQAISTVLLGGGKIGGHTDDGQATTTQSDSPHSGKKTTKSHFEQVSSENPGFIPNDNETKPSNKEQTTSPGQLTNLKSPTIDLKSMSYLLSPRIAMNHSTIASALSRAQALLKSDVACQALERATMQLVIASNRPTKDNLTSLLEQKIQGTMFVYLDAKSGLSGIGRLPGTDNPDVTVYLGFDDLIDVIDGKLDILKALEEEKAFMTGSMPILSKMRHLLYLSPTSSSK